MALLSPVSDFVYDSVHEGSVRDRSLVGYSMCRIDLAVIRKSERKHTNYVTTTKPESESSC